MLVATRHVSMDLVKEEAPDEGWSSDSEARNVMVIKQSCPNELHPTVKQEELADRTDDYVCRSVNYPFLNKKDSTDTFRAVNVKPDHIAIELGRPSVTRINNIRIYNKFIVIEPKLEVDEGSCNKSGIKEQAVDTEEVPETLGATTVEPVLELIKCEPELIQGLDDDLPHQRFMECRGSITISPPPSSSTSLPPCLRQGLSYEDIFMLNYGSEAASDSETDGQEMVALFIPRAYRSLMETPEKEEQMSTADPFRAEDFPPIFHPVPISCKEMELPHWSYDCERREFPDQIDARLSILEPATGSNNIKVEPFKINSSSAISIKASELPKPPKEPTGVKPLQCDQCNYSTHRRDNLITHKMVHSDVKPFRCEQCDYATNFKRNLNSHMMMHSGVKPFRCDDCSYTGASKQSLKLHVAQHTGVKRLQCILCEYATNRKGDLERHLKTHSGIRPYRCNQCYYSTIEERRLKHHLLVHSSVKPYRCDQCGYSASRKHLLKNHMTRHLET